MQHFMKKHLLIIVTILTGFTANAQWAQSSLITTKEQNVDWLKTLHESNLEVQLSLIKNRLLTDTATIQFMHYSGVINQGKIKSKCKPSYFITYNKDYEYLGINLDKDFVLGFVDLLTSKNVKEFKILNEEYNQAQINALYGTQGDCGVIQITLNNNRIYKYVRNSFSR